MTKLNMHILEENTSIWSITLGCNHVLPELGKVYQLSFSQCLEGSAYILVTFLLLRKISYQRQLTEGRVIGGLQFERESGRSLTVGSEQTDIALEQQLSTSTHNLTCKDPQTEDRKSTLGVLPGI
jgi:hypothetical protein